MVFSVCITVDNSSISGGNLTVPIYITVFDLRRILNGQRQRGHGLVAVNAIFHFQCVTVFPILIHCVRERDLEIRIVGSQRRLRPGHIRCYVSGLAIGVVGRHLHSGGVKGVLHLVCRLVRQLRDLNALYGAANSHQVGRVILEVDRAILVHDGAANGILRLCAAGGKDVVGCRVGL